MCRLLHFRNWCTLECDSVVIAAEQSQEALVVRFNQTPFYPSGGGQPSDKGQCLSEGGASFPVVKVDYSKDKRLIYHYIDASLPAESFSVGSKWKLSVDPAARLLHSRLHSAGHIVDAAVKILNLDFKPSAASHHPTAAYVTFVGSLGTATKDSLKQALQEECDKLVEQDLPVYIEFANDDPEDQQCQRTMRIANIITIPCGGTHVCRLSEVGKVTIRKVEAKNGTVRIGYAIE